MAQPTTYWINYFGRKYGIDPRAAIAVARGEGGLVNRQGDIGDLAGGGSYGPFQLYAQGALPRQFRGRSAAADAWAWSPQGIEYAIRKMSESGARGLTGARAVEAIVRRFERPANPDKSVAAAIARLGGGGTSAGAYSAPGYAAMEGPQVAGPQVNPRAARNAFVQAIIAQIGQPLDVMSAINAMRSARGTGGPAYPSPATGGASSVSTVGSASQMLRRLGLADAVTSGTRTPAQNRATGGSPTSYHLPGGPEAFDLNPRDPQFRNLINMARSNPGQFIEFFYDPLGWYIKDGKIRRGSIGGHGDHGHVVFR